MSDIAGGEGPITARDAVSLLLNKEGPKAQPEPVEEKSQQPEAEPVEVEVEAEGDAPVEIEAEEEADGDAALAAEDEYEDVDGEPSEDEAKPLYTVKIDGQEAQVELGELINGYQRQADYSRKMQDLSAKSKKADAEIQQATQLRDQYIQALQMVEQTFNSQEPGEEYWKDLYENDPIEFVRQKETFRTKKEALSQIEAERKKMQTQKARELHQKREEIRSQEYEKMLRAIPEWKDQKVYAAETAEMIPFLKSRGYTDQELSNLIYAHHVEALHSLWKMETMKGNKVALKKKAQAVPRVVRPGQPRPKSEGQEKLKRNALGKLSRTGKLNDAVDYLLTSSRKG